MRTLSIRKRDSQRMMRFGKGYPVPGYKDCCGKWGSVGITTMETTSAELAMEDES